MFCDFPQLRVLGTGDQGWRSQSKGKSKALGSPFPYRLHKLRAHEKSRAPGATYPLDPDNHPRSGHYIRLPRCPPPPPSFILLGHMTDVLVVGCALISKVGTP